MAFVYGKRSRGIRYRQLARLAEFGTDSDLGRDALKQLNHAVILHVDAASRVLSHNVKLLLQLRCPICGQRHWRKHFAGVGSNKVTIYCSYGIKYSLKNLLHAVIGAAIHGED